MRHCIHLLVFLSIALPVSSPAWAQISFDREPINYSEAEVHDPISKLQAKINSGDVKLEFDDEHGYLKSVLKALDVPQSSQMLVFSKTSFQLRRISPRTPRSLYFNDDVYIGWVPRGDVMEISAVDPNQGAIFYTLAQEESEKPKFLRDQGNCLTCHASSRTQDVPGHLVRSVYTMSSGQPQFGAGTFRINHTSPLEKRWGGYYVTGQHGKQRHMGNVFSDDRDNPEAIDIEAGANVTDLSELTRIHYYLTPHSDIVALMILEHQADMHNFITLANYETRMSKHNDAVMNEVLEREEDYISDTTGRRIKSAAEKLVRYMLFVDEAELTDRIQGTSPFTEEFQARGIRDSQGRSLRDLDLETRLFKYPCSYLIYSDSFRNLPEPVMNQVAARLHEVLTGEDQSEDFSHLSAADRQAILEILLETHEELAQHWKGL